MKRNNELKKGRTSKTYLIQFITFASLRKCNFEVSRNQNQASNKQSQFNSALNLQHIHVDGKNNLVE